MRRITEILRDEKLDFTCGTGEVTTRMRSTQQPTHHAGAAYFAHDE